MTQKRSAPDVVPSGLKYRRPAKSSAWTPSKTTEVSKSLLGKMVSSKLLGAKDHLLLTLEFMNDHLTFEDVELIKILYREDRLVYAAERSASLLFSFWFEMICSDKTSTLQLFCITGPG